MSEVRVRNLESWVVTHLRDQAKRNGRSLEAELRDLLRREAARPKHELATDLDRMRGELLETYGPFSDSVADIRADRDARG